MAKVTVARSAHDLHALHAEGHVGLGDERALVALVECAGQPQPELNLDCAEYSGFPQPLQTKCPSLGKNLSYSPVPAGSVPSCEGPERTSYPAARLQLTEGHSQQRAKIEMYVRTGRRWLGIDFHLFGPLGVALLDALNHHDCGAPTKFTGLDDSR